MTRALLVIKLLADECVNFDLTNLAPDGLLNYFNNNDMIMLMKSEYKRWAIVALVLSAVLLLVLFIFTDPREVGLLGILVVVLAIYVFFTALFYLCLSLFNKKKENNSSAGHRQLLISATLAFAPVLLVIFNSLGSIGIIEVAAIILFEVITIFLITKRTQ